MADSNAERSMLSQVDGRAMMRQMVLLVGIAASVAIGVAVVLWSQTPNYQLLYGSLSDKDVGEVMEALQGAGVPYKVEQGSGAVMVPSSRVHEARMKLAGAGLPKGSNVGFELLEADKGFGTSQFIEQARYQRALEGELARSIMQVNSVRGARVHIAVPKQSVFLRDAREPSASVLIDLYPGRRLEEGQVAAIAHLVSASVPNLAMDKVTLVDQHGRLLTRRDGARDMGMTAERFEYTRRLEESYIKRIEDLLTPLVGHGRVRAQVTADLDFTAVEQTRESFNPDSAAMRSEQVAEERRVGSAGEGGVPGALSNQPPGVATVPELAAAEGPDGAAAPATEQPQDLRMRATRNYELDKTISHTRMPMGSIRRLSVAVVVDQRRAAAPGAEGAAAESGMAAEELERITALVRDAVGFNAERGDSINVIPADFLAPEQAEALPEPPVWEQPWVWDLAKQVGGILLVLLLAFGVLRPALRALLSREASPAQPALAALGGPGAQAALPAGADLPRLAHNPAAERIADQSAHAPGVERVKSFVSQEPRLAAQVVKNWVGD